MRVSRLALPALVAVALLTLALPAVAQLTTDPTQGCSAQGYTSPDEAPLITPTGLGMYLDWSARFYAAVIPARWLDGARLDRVRGALLSNRIGRSLTR